MRVREANSNQGREEMANLFDVVMPNGKTLGDCTNDERMSYVAEKHWAAVALYEAAEKLIAEYKKTKATKAA
jgi:hypothetical protein